MPKKKNLKLKVTNITFEDEGVTDTFHESYKKKEFAKNFILTKGDLVKTYNLTFPEKQTDEYKAKYRALKILDNLSVQDTITELLPSDNDLADVINQAIRAQVDEPISWGEKHRYLDTALKMKGHLKDEGNKTQVNIGMVIKEQ